VSGLVGRLLVAGRRFLRLVAQLGHVGPQPAPGGALLRGQSAEGQRASHPGEVGVLQPVLHLLADDRAGSGRFRGEALLPGAKVGAQPGQGLPPPAQPLHRGEVKYPCEMNRQRYNEALYKANGWLQEYATKENIPLLDLCAWSELGRPSNSDVY